MKKLFKTTIAITGFFFLLSAGLMAQTPWVAPKEADALKNPVANNATTAAEAKKLYNQLCTVCHGDKGKGDGIAAAGLNPKPANHTSDKVQNQTDGAIFWKLTNGRPPMAAYASTLSETQRWELVNYI